MSLQQHAQPTSTNYDHNVDVIITANGSTDLSRAAYRGGALIGYESRNSRPPEEIPVEFVDWPFRDPDVSFEDHLEVVKRERPRLAVAPDIDDAENLDEALVQADALAEYAQTVIVVPKDVKPSAIPSRFRVGIPAQEKFGGTPWPLWEYAGCGDVHILGGSPKKQREISEYVRGVNSVDSTSPVMAAQFGNVWTGDSWEERGDNYYDRIERSMNNCLRMWNDEVDEARVEKIRLEIDKPDTTVVSVSRLIAPPTREEMGVAPGEKTPHPGRAFFEQSDAPSPTELQSEDYFAES